MVNESVSPYDRRSRESEIYSGTSSSVCTRALYGIRETGYGYWIWMWDMDMGHMVYGTWGINMGSGVWIWDEDMGYECWTWDVDTGRQIFRRGVLYVVQEGSYFVIIPIRIHMEMHI